MNRFIPLTRLFLVALTAGFLSSAGSVSAQEQPAVNAKEQQDFDFANGLYQRKMYDNAANKYDEFIQTFPGSVHRATALFRKAESFYQYSLQKSGEDPVAAKVLLIEAQFGFQEYIRFAPEGDKILDALLRHGEISYKVDDYRQGLISLKRVLDESAAGAQIEAALFYAARCHEGLEEFSEAEQQYQRIREVFAQGEFAAFSTYLLAQLYEKTDRLEPAAQLLNRLWKNEDRYRIPEDSNLIEKTQLLSAQILYRMDRFEEASEAYLAYINQNPTGEHAQEAKYGAAWALYRMKNYNEALAIANTLKRQMLKPELLAGILFLQGTCSYQQKEYSDAISFFKEVIADPNAGEYRERAWYQLCWSHFLSNDLERTVSQCRLMLDQKLDPSISSNVHYLMGQALTRLNRLEEAAAEMRLVYSIQQDGEYAEDARYLLGDLLYRMKDYTESGKVYLQFAHDYPDSTELEDALTRAVNAQFQAKEYALAVATTERLLHQYPQTPTRQELVYRKALALYQLGQLDAALDSFSAVIAAENTEAKKDDAFYWTAYIHEKQNNLPAASAAYQRLIARYPEYQNIHDARLRKAYCDYKTADYDAAFNQFHALLMDETRHELTPEIVFWLVLHAEQNHRYEQALQIAQRAMERFDNPAVRERAIIAQGAQLIALKRWKEALELIESFEAQFPESAFKPEGLWTRAKAFEGLGKKEDALRYYEESLLASQDHGSPDPALEASIYLDRGKILYEQGKYKDALESFLRVSILYDHAEFTPEAMYLGIQCHLAMDEPAEAQAAYNDLLTNYPEHSWTQKAKESFANQIQQPIQSQP